MAKNEAAKMVLATLNELNITLPAKKAATKPVDEVSIHCPINHINEC